LVIFAAGALGLFLLVHMPADAGYGAVGGAAIGLEARKSHEFARSLDEISDRCRRTRLAQRVGARAFGIVGRDGGYTRQVAEACVLIPVVSPERTTPHTEGFCAVIWHLLVSHPALQRSVTKWESTK